MSGNVSIDLPQDLLESIQRTRTAAIALAKLPSDAKNNALEAIAVALEQQSEMILVTNQKDVAAANASKLPSALIARLKLDANKLKSMVAGVRDVIRLDDPIGDRQIHRELDAGLVLERLSCPLGVIGVIFEARPDAVTQIAALGIKSGNGVILKGGSEAVHSCEAIAFVMYKALEELFTKHGGVSPHVVQLLTTRAETLAILKMDKLIDLIIPRGSNQFVRYIQNNTHIPVLGHADGVCHLYVDESADLDKAVAIAVDSKTQYPAACNAIETMLVHNAIAPKFLPLALAALQERGVELRGCDHTRKIIAINPATESDWSMEYCDLILSIKIVDSLEEAMTHITTYGSKHTEAIVTEDQAIANIFTSDIDAAGVYHNCSTRFADGFRYGFGAEVGISTNKMPPRGPVGLEGLVTYKYRLVGNGHIVANYAGTNAKAFTHRDL
ncbi:gamma-glutamyl phosphate reductase [Pseudanabaena sp. lw0831]|uniref:glutamate-5-semialdehyde dehydrogenase n=1 Tax=Pseudanabaena sp. lw0831 TaxID=1357935 RepID=UPI0019166374|nr:glutamate-5-semialdehyde dehydrogenase [Pseudanabaena sp. lw0831]GBO54873.1 gamma-glutamyl phosphate reductase [Pseudanabaena sp. lw0831]